ncbi:MAG: hypothetical protein ACLGI2_17735 [Acidimicrobiia bacterium]
MTSTVSRPQGPSPEPADDDGGVGAAVRSAMGAAQRMGSFSAAGVVDALEAPLRALSRKAAADALAQPQPVSNTTRLAEALGERPKAPLLGGATATALATKMARRVGPLRFLARRTPMWILAAAVPALTASIARGRDELELVASHLVHRARAAGVEPDAERLRRAAVQLVSAGKVDPDTDPSHISLARAWLQRGLRSTLPFAPGVATRNPEGLAAAAAALPVHVLAPR